MCIHAKIFLCLSLKQIQSATKRWIFAIGQTQSLSDVVTEYFSYVAIKSLDRKCPSNSLMIVGFTSTPRPLFHFLITIFVNDLNNPQHFVYIFLFTENRGNNLSVN